MSAERPSPDAALDVGATVTMDLAGCVAIVTGSTRGIGWGIARRLCAACAAVMCNARTAAGAVAEFDAVRRRNARVAAAQKAIADKRDDALAKRHDHT